jgi:hypothetical protein
MDYLDIFRMPSGRKRSGPGFWKKEYQSKVPMLFPYKAPVKE